MDKKPRKDGGKASLEMDEKEHTMESLQQGHHRGVLGSNQPSSSAQMSDLATSRNQLLFGRFSPVHLWLQDEAYCKVLEMLLREFRAGRDADIRAWAFSLWCYTRTGVTRYPEPLWR
jgi:hypothetical protein